MSTPYVVVMVNGRAGGRLLNGDPSGLGGEVTYQAAITTNGIDRQPVGPIFSRPKQAHRYADKLQRQMAQEVEDVPA
jgi:hypothetical protein